MIYASSRRTIMDGEVVTFATVFRATPGALTPAWETRGTFEVSASRNGLVVHRAHVYSRVTVEELVTALRAAAAAVERLVALPPGSPSLYPSEPTPIEHPKEPNP